MIALELNDEQRQAVDADLTVCTAILGGPGTGKSRALLARLARVKHERRDADPLVVVNHRELASYSTVLLANAGIAVQIVDDVDAEQLFEHACASLFRLAWEEFTAKQLDPEVPGLRSPERFAEAAFRLIRKLREANITPDEFLSRSLAGATEFHAKPPNLAHPALLYSTKESYRDSLNVTPAELQRQYRREIDLAKILTKLYASYIEHAESQGQMTGRDTVAAAIRCLSEHPEIASAERSRRCFAFVDSAEDITAAEITLLQAIFGKELGGVTFAGDPASAISTLRSGRPEAAFDLATNRVTLQQQHRSPLAVENACRQLITLNERPRPTNAASNSHEPADILPAVQLYRASSVRDEAYYIADRVRIWIDEGVAPNRIAVLMRSVRSVEPYEAALLDRGVPVITSGDTNIFTDRRSLDALALLWNVHDPFRHDWLLRTLGNPALGLSDASLATFCAEPPSPERPLFVLEDEPAPTVRSSRWDPKRDLRLGWNVVRGEQDAALSDEARERIQRFRALRETWLEAMNHVPFDQFVRLVWRDGLAREGLAGSARAQAQAAILMRLLVRLSAFVTLHPDAILADILEYAERRMASDLESCEPFDEGSAFVQLLSVDAARGREFDHVVIANVRAGAFPQWYVPDAFLFSPRLGMIPKENTGDAIAARTAKFTYYSYRNGIRERYNERERRAFIYALRRARVSVTITASEPPTKGVAAPEFLEELRAARLRGVKVD